MQVRKDAERIERFRLVDAFISSELHGAELERRLVTRTGLFNFGAKRTELTAVTWPIDFLPG